MHTNPIRVASRLALLLLSISVASAAAIAQGDPGSRSRAARGGRGSRAVSDVATAQQALLAAPTPTETLFSELLFAALQEASQRKLPSTMEDPDANYTPEYVAYRAEVYGELRARPDGRAFLRGLAARAPTGAFDFVGVTAAMILADAPDGDDLEALLTGYLATSLDSRAGIARQLGRAAGALPAADAARAEKVMAQLRQDAAGGRATQRGAAIEGLYRAGAVDEALGAIKPLLMAESDPLETVPLLSACARLLKRTDLDPFLRARAVAAACAAIEQLLDSDEPIQTTQVIAGEGRTLRSAISFLQEMGGDAEFALMLRCLREPRGPRLLGMDGLQNLRFALQGKRAKVAPELGAQLDDHYLQLLLDAGNRLFALEEEPLLPDEHRAWWEARDLRYNALSYLNDQFFRNAAVKERLGREIDLPVLLGTLVRSKQDLREEGGAADAPYLEVEEKVENRVLALQLLALIQREWNRDPAGLDLFAEAHAVLCIEVQAPLPDFAELAAFRAARAPGLVFEVAIVRPPGDAWVQRACCQAIANLGYVVNTVAGRIRIEADGENPWPWPAAGATQR